MRNEEYNFAKIVNEVIEGYDFNIARTYLSLLDINKSVEELKQEAFKLIQDTIKDLLGFTDHDKLAYHGGSLMRSPNFICTITETNNISLSFSIGDHTTISSARFASVLANEDRV